MMANRKLNFPATERNKIPILKVLKETLDKKLLKKSTNYNVLEIASGSGQHAVYFAQELPQVTTWQPSDFDQENLLSIGAYVEESSLSNLKMPVKIDITESLDRWPIEATTQKFDLIMCVNMIHISPWKCTESLFRNSSLLLNPGGILFTYGPYARQGEITPQSNISFNQSLKDRNSEWGLRDTDDLLKEATKNSFVFDSIHEMPSNNHSLVYIKTTQS